MRTDSASRGAGPRPRWAFLVLPLLLSLVMVAFFIIDLQDRLHLPLAWWGRNGLVLLETLWDTDAFWGALWFNLLLIMAFSAMLLFRMHPGSSELPGMTPRHEQRAFVISGLVAAGIISAMTATWTPSFSIAGNWFTTQFAYQLPAWPAIAGFLGLVVFSMRLPGTKTKQNAAGWILVLGFLATWLYLVAITEFHPHALLDFGMPLYTLVMTIGFPVTAGMVLVHALALGRRPAGDDPVRGDRATGPSRAFSWLFIAGLGVLVALQLAGAANPVTIGQETMFSFNTSAWWWPVSHAWGWIFVVATTTCIFFGTRLAYHRKWASVRDTPVAIYARTRLTRKASAAIMAGIVAVAAIGPVIQVAAWWDASRQPLLLVNQVGYLPNAPKRLVYQSIDWNDPVPDNAPFTVHAESGSHVLTSVMFKNVTTRYGHNYMVGSFDEITAPGRYYVTATVNGREVRSAVFEIGGTVYQDAMERMLRFFYYQRCNYEVLEIVPGYSGHAACHMDDGEVWDGTRWVHKDLTGGWHDAGDYNKYNSWFQTQWYCVHSLAEAAFVNPSNVFNETFPSLYDTNLPDVVEETLWGAKFLLNCINEEGHGGEEARYQVYRDVSGYRHESGREARMSYWGPPELDWTTPRRVVLEHGNYFVGYHRGYAVAGTLLQVARLIDDITATNPSIDLPTWFPWNTTRIRELAGLVYAKYASLQGDPDDVQSLIGKLLYAEENAIINDYNWTTFDALVMELLPKIPGMQSYPLWFGWAGYYALGNVLSSYIIHNRTLPVDVASKIDAIQAGHFTQLFDEPFRVKHGRVNITGQYGVHFPGVDAIDDPVVQARMDRLQAGENVLFFGAERQTDLLTSAWLQLLATIARNDTANPALVQSMLDWLMGVNPAGLCMIEGVGSKNMPQYHHRYSYNRNPRGAVPGAIPNGLSLVTMSQERASALGVPRNDSSFLAILGDNCTYASWPGNPLFRDGVPSNPNEVWIPHNAMFLRIATMLDASALFR